MAVDNNPRLHSLKCLLLGARQNVSVENIFIYIQRIYFYIEVFHCE